jgi:hypothetical protein
VGGIVVTEKHWGKIQRNAQLYGLDFCAFILQIPELEKSRSRTR